MRITAVGIVTWLSVLSSWAVAADWMQFRGPNGQGISSDKDVPATWSSTENIAWKVEVPGTGHASPIVWDDAIFVATCREDAQERVLLCYDRPSGKLRWQQVVLQSPLEDKHQLNSFASSTPATDGNGHGASPVPHSPPEEA